MPQNTHGLLTLLDVDNTLVSANNALNTALVRDLKAAGVEDICLFTSMSAGTLLSEDSQGKSGPSLTRYELVKKLEEEGFTVHAVITPIDPFYRKKPNPVLSDDPKEKDSRTVGFAYEELLKPQYMRRHDELKSLSLDKFAKDSEYQQIRQEWNYYSLRSNLVNGLIKCDSQEMYTGLIEYLEQEVESNIESRKLLLTPEKSKKDDADSILTLLEEMKKHISAIKKAGEDITEDDQKHENSHPFIPQKAMKYILEISWIKESAWIVELLKKGHRSPWDKGSMYASVVNDPFFKTFNGFLFFDDKDECLKTVSNLHTTLSIEKPLYSIKVNPKFKDPDGYYKEKLNESGVVTAIIDEINNEITDLLKRKNVTEETPLSQEEQERHNVLQSLRTKVAEITNKINTYQNKDWKKTYKKELRDAINESLNSGKLDKYNGLDKLGRSILNLLTGLTVLAPIVKYCITGSFFFSREGKSKEAVLRMQDLADRSLKGM